MSVIFPTTPLDGAPRHRLFNANGVNVFFNMLKKLHRLTILFLGTICMAAGPLGPVEVIEAEPVEAVSSICSARERVRESSSSQSVSLGDSNDCSHCTGWEMPPPASHHGLRSFMGTGTPLLC